MAKLITIYWRDIPSQVIAKAGRKTSKIMLEDRFQVAIDRAAMRAGAGTSDAYMACLLYTSPSPRDQRGSRMPSSA